MGRQNFLTEEVEKYKNGSKNITYVRGALIGRINADPSFRKNYFKEGLEEVRRANITDEELYEKYNPTVGGDIEKNTKSKELYTEEDLNYCITYLNLNFSREWVEHTKEVGKSVLENQEKSIGVKTNIKDNDRGSYKAKGASKNTNSATNYLIVGAVVLIVVVGIIALRP